jgi:hypothetical protein
MSKIFEITQAMSSRFGIQTERDEDHLADAVANCDLERRAHDVSLRAGGRQSRLQFSLGLR